MTLHCIHGDATALCEFPQSSLALDRFGARLRATIPEGNDVKKNQYVTRMFKEHTRALRAYLSRVYRSEDDIADTIQEVFLRVLRLDDPYKLDLNTRGYLLRVARNLVRDKVRRDRCRHLSAHEPFITDDLVCDQPSPETHTSRGQGVRAITSALATADARVGEVLALSCVDDLTHSEIAARLGVTTRTVERYMQRARQHCHLNLTPRIFKAMAQSVA